MTPIDLQRWLQLTLAQRCNAAHLKILWQQAGSVSALQALPLAPLVALGVGDATIEHFAEWQAGRVKPVIAERVARALQWADEPGHRVLVYGDADYPPLLFNCTDPPPQLFVCGDPARLALPQFAVVGSRHPSVDGRKLARRFAGELAEHGWQITSGLALGIDAESHQAALKHAAGTVAVLGSGIDQIHPTSHRRLAAEIETNGVVISEFAPGAPAEAWHFPERNRVISGLSHGVLVVEAAERSGSLITARLAAEQGREVFAIPGSINNPLARGCHRLIRQGAKLVECVDDILEELPALLAWQRAQCDVPPLNAAASEPAPLAKPMSDLLKQLGYDPITLDSLVLAVAKPVEQLLPVLLQLELAGLVEARLDGYVRSRA